MASRDLINRIQEAFKDPEKVKADEYQKLIESTASKVADDVEKTLFILVGLIAIFILIVENQIGIIRLENLELKDFSILAIIIPLLFSYSHFNLATSLSRFEQISVLYKTIVKQRHKPIYEQRLTEFFLATPNLYDYKHFSRKESIQRVQFALWAIQFFSVTLIIPFVFQAYAFYKLMSLYHPNYFSLIGLSLGISMVFELQSFLCVITLLQETRNR